MNINSGTTSKDTHKFKFNQLLYTAKILSNPIQARPVGSFMHRSDLKEYAKNLVSLAKKTLRRETEDILYCMCTKLVVKVFRHENLTYSM